MTYPALKEIGKVMSTQAIFAATRWIAVLMACTWLNAPARAETITLSSTNYPPYYGPDLPRGGIITVITTEAFKRVGYKVEINYRPWARTLKEVKDGKSHGIVGVWYSRERATFLAYSKPLYSNIVGFYARNDHLVDVHDLTQLKARVGIVRGYVNPAAFEAAHLDVEEATDDQENLLKLAAGRVDLVLIDKGLAAYLLNDKLLKLRNQLSWLEPRVETLPLYVAMSKKSPGWQKRLKDFNSGLEQLRKDGTLAQLQHGFGY
jgi:polar amino acid transport system substrate-binding protein